ncbi:MAG: hypothetical protein ACI4VG_03865 [Lachnospiraceae bacterium]
MENQDFKYVCQDMTNLYIGARYTYGELMALDEIPFKLKTILSHYMLKEVAEDTKIEDHIFYLDKNSLSFLVYSQMKAKFLLSVWQEKEGKRPAGYRRRTCRIEEIVDSSELKEKMHQIIVEEVHITKLGLMKVS